MTLIAARTAANTYVGNQDGSFGFCTLEDGTFTKNKKGTQLFFGGLGRKAKGGETFFREVTNDLTAISLDHQKRAASPFFRAKTASSW